MRRTIILATVIVLITTHANSRDPFLDTPNDAIGLVFLTIPFGGEAPLRPRAGLGLSYGYTDVPDRGVLEFSANSKGEPTFSMFGTELNDPASPLLMAEDDGDWSIGEMALRIVGTAALTAALVAGIVWLEGVKYRCCRQ